MDNYAKHIFTPSVAAEQERLGMTARFEAMYRNRFTGGIDADTRAIA